MNGHVLTRECKSCGAEFKYGAISSSYDLDTCSECVVRKNRAAEAETRRIGPQTEINDKAKAEAEE